MDDRDPETGGYHQRECPISGTFRVILWGERRIARQKIGDVIRTAGAHPVPIEALSDLQPVTCCSDCCLAVAVTGPIPEGNGMQAIRDLKVKGFKIVACEDGAGSWPIKTKCLPLLAGALQLLDSLSAEFSLKLRRVVEGILRTAAQRQNEDHEIACVMRSLGMVGESPKMMRVFRSVVRFSSLSDLPVLITGETGTGKEGLARALHRLDPNRNRGPFIPVNCGAINTGLAESEFFGHRRGAFTGAERERKGLIRSAEGGVLFLDEIADLELSLQTKMLRVLQENRVLGVGEDREKKVNVRIVAASNRDLDQMVQENKFRADLFHRLNVLSIQVPPLRQRQGDLEALVGHFLEKYRSLADSGAQTVDSDFLEAVSHIRMPGNVRQLENLVRQALVRKATDSPLHLGDLSAEVLKQLFDLEENPAVQKIARTNPFDSVTLSKSLEYVLEANDWNLRRSLEKCERQALEAAIKRAHGNQAGIARLLGITPRSVYNKIQKYQLKC